MLCDVQQVDDCVFVTNQLVPLCRKRLCAAGRVKLKAGVSPSQRQSQRLRFVVSKTGVAARNYSLNN